MSAPLCIALLQVRLDESIPVFMWKILLLQYLDEGNIRCNYDAAWCGNLGLDEVVIIVVDFKYEMIGTSWEIIGVNGYTFCRITENLKNEDSSYCALNRRAIVPA